MVFYVLAMSKVISGSVPTCDSADSWRLYSAAPLGDEATGNMMRWSHYPNTVLTSRCPIILYVSSYMHGRIGRARASRAGDREFGSQSSQSNDLWNRYLFLPSLGFGINMI